MARTAWSILLELLRERGMEGDVALLREALPVLLESITDGFATQAKPAKVVPTACTRKPLAIRSGMSCPPIFPDPISILDRFLGVR